MNAAVRAAALAAVLATAGCVTANYGHTSFGEPVDDAAFAALVSGEATLADCLQALGAPVRVFEYRVGPTGESGMVLLWSWRDEAGWGIDVSSGDDAIPGSVSFDAVSTDLPGCVLWFGPDLRLEKARKGTLGDLLPRRLRPSAAGEG